MTGVGSLPEIGYDYDQYAYDADNAVVLWDGDTTGYNGSETIEVLPRDYTTAELSRAMAQADYGLDTRFP